VNNTQTVEDQNDKLQEQLDEIRARTAILDAESAQGRTINDGLQSKLSGLEAEIATLREQAEERRRQQEEAERSSATEVIFRRRDPASATPREAHDVSALENWGTQIKNEACGRQLIRKKTLALPTRR
jgi:chromosome segregation ATPase